ncbi:MAG: purine-nucleoside/S-methyl-5-thioadenosine phosphorylase / adenosine deaminase, partial [Candidatus Hydrogenedentes bacterium]|nr:purine-nucleoside/S-methyl-5-thioadenosine phosphorylase / adenosine deaminase [Candidatus Hydrogenedentota bacterium]
CAACGADARALVCGRQVQGTAIALVSGADRGRGALDYAAALDSVDGLVTDCPGLPLAIFVADCVPIYLFDPRRRVVGLVHAGRAGTFRNIAGVAVRAMSDSYGSDASDVHALIGPSAGSCCYEVSEEIVREWQGAGMAVQGRNLDLWASIVRQLADAGLPEQNVECAGICTICQDRFFSYRRGDRMERNMALLML